MSANTFSIGDLEVLVVSDGTLTLPGNAYFQTTDEQWAPHKRFLDHDGNLAFALNCFVVRSGDRRVLIDTGLGPIQQGPYIGGHLLDELAAAGVDPGSIDAVFITHLHADHYGTIATKSGGAYVPAFPNATYHWTSADQAFVTGDALPAGFLVWRHLLDPVLDRYTPTDDGAVLAPGVNVIALPGHTPGHAGVVLSSGDQRAFLMGDAISCPVQLEEPEWSGMGDIDKALARRTQEAVAREIEGTATLLGAGHFPGLTLGRVLRGEGRRYWEPVANPVAS